MCCTQNRSTNCPLVTQSLDVCFIHSISPRCANTVNISCRYTLHNRDKTNTANPLNGFVGALFVVVMLIILLDVCDPFAGSVSHDDVIKWKYFPRYWPFVRGIHRSPVNSPHKGQWRGALMISLTCAWISGWVNNGKVGDLRRHRANYEFTVMVASLRW